MNKSYRVLWSSIRKCFVVVDENAKSKGKPSSSRKAIAVAVASLFLAPGLASAACSGQASVTTALTDTQCYSSDQDVTISNTGSINATGTPFAAAVDIETNPYSHTLINNGNLGVAASLDATTTTADYSYAYAYAYAIDTVASGVLANGDLSGGFNNTGLINAQSVSSTEASSLLVNDASNDYGKAYAYAYMGGASANGVLINGDVSGHLTNDGSITASASASATANVAAKIDNASGDYAIVYSGANSYAAAYGMNVNGNLTAGAILNNNGAIVANSSAASVATSDVSSAEYSYAYAYASAQTYAGAYGLSIDGSLVGGAIINNYGTIDASASTSTSTSASGMDAHTRTNAYAAAYGITVDDGILDGSALNNYGSISATANSMSHSSAIGTSDSVLARSNGSAGAIGVNINGLYDGVHDVSLDGFFRNDGTIQANANGSSDATASSSSGYDSAYAYAYAGASGGADAAGVYLNGYFNAGASFINNGTINVMANAASSATSQTHVSGDNNAYAYAYAGANASAESVGVNVNGGLSNGASFVNHGTINVTANSTPSASATAGADLPGSQAYAYAETRAYATAYGVIMHAFNSPVLDEGASFNNDGTISVVANAMPSSSAIATGDNASADAYAYAYAYASGVYLGGDVASGATVNNLGTISAIANGGATATNTNSYAYAYGMVIDGNVDAGATINNSGVISAVANALQGGAVGLFVDGNLDGILNNSGTISAKGLGGIDSTNTYSIVTLGGSGTINNLAGGLLDGGLMAAGSINVNNDGILNTKLGSSFVGGDYNQGATGKLAIAAVDTSNYGSLTVGGAATLAAGTGIRVAVDPANTLVANDVLTNVIGASALSSSTINVADNNLALNFVASNNGANGIDLTAASTGLTTLVAAVQGAGLSSATGAASLLDGLLGTVNDQSGEFSDFLYTLGSSGTQQEVANSISQLLPLIAGGVTRTTLNSMHDINRIVQERQEANLGRSSGDTFLGDKHFWLKPFGSWANQDDRNGTSGYDANTYGLILGADAELSDVNRIGAAFAYSRSDVDGNSSSANQSADIDNYQAIFYGSHSLNPATDINYQLDFGFHSNDGHRRIIGIGSAKSDYDSWSAHAGIGLAHTLSLNEKTTFTPSIRADYAWIRDDSYREKGAGAFNLNVGKNRTDELILGVDGKLAHAITDTATVNANLGLGYDVINDRASLTSTFAGLPGASFTTRGIDSSPWLARGGLGVVVNSTETIELSARYDFEVREDFDNQTASVKVRWAF